MVLVEKKSRGKPVIYAVLALVVLVGGGYLIYNNFIAGKGPVKGGGTQVMEKDLPTYNDFGEDLFQQGKYSDLKDFSGNKLPIHPDQVPKGRDNPFLPKL